MSHSSASGRLLTALIFAGGSLWLAMLLLARSGTRRMPWPIELLDTFALYAFAPFLVLGLVALVLRSRLLTSLLVVVGLVFWQQFGHLFLPTPVHAAPSGPTLRILTYNVLGRYGDASELAALVQAEEPDVVLLQELTERYAEDFQRLVGDQYPYRVFAEIGTNNDGSGTFSQVPILEAKGFRLTRNGNVFQQVRLDSAAGPITLFNVHLATPRLSTRNPEGPIPPLILGFGSPDRERELEWLIGTTGKLSEPYILAGDFNLAAGSRPHRSFPQHWRDAFGERGWGFGHTFPTRYTLWGSRLQLSMPVVRIDYILSSSDVAPSHARVPWIDGSDHLPVLAELRLPTVR